MKSVGKFLLTLAVAVILSAGMRVSAAPGTPMRLLTWSAPAGANHFTIYSAPAANGPFTKIGETNVPVFATNLSGFFQVKIGVILHKELSTLKGLITTPSATAFITPVELPTPVSGASAGVK